MKNTLIAALLLSSGALYAASTADVVVQTSPDQAPLTLSAVEATLGTTGSSSITGSNNSIVFDANGETSLTSYAITLKLDILRSAISSPVLSHTGASSVASGWGLYISGNTASFSNSGSTWNGSDTLDVAEGDTLTFVHVSQDGGLSDGICYIINQTSGEFISASSSEGYRWSGNMDLTSDTARLWTNGGNAQMTILGVTDLSAYNLNSVEGISVGGLTIYGSIIPEPTTATLSLLALAGLAARRRRK